MNIGKFCSDVPKGKVDPFNSLSPPQKQIMFYNIQIMQQKMRQTNQTSETHMRPLPLFYQSAIQKPTNAIQDFPRNHIFYLRFKLILYMWTVICSQILEDKSTTRVHEQWRDHFGRCYNIKIFIY